MFDSQKIDSYFAPSIASSKTKKSTVSRRERIIMLTKLALPSLAALLIGVLILLPQFNKDINDMTSGLITPHKGELEKFHMENSIFYITDNKNMVNNFNADTLDETAPGSKIIKMINPKGTIPTAQKDEVTIQSPIGYYDQNNKLLTLQSGVNLDYSTGLTTTTEEMFFDFNISKAYGVKPINSKSDSIEVNAEGFEYYKDKNLLIYTGKTHITIQSENIDGGI